MAKYGRGLICLAMEGSQAKKLNLSLMSPINQSRNKTAFAISIEAKKGITTGISAKDRAKTIKVASKKNASRKDIVSPGHVFPIIAKDGGVLVRAGHTEASVDISKLAKKNNSAVICEIMKDDGTMARGRDLVMFAKKHKLGIAKIEDLISYRLKKEKLVRLKKKLDIKIQDQNFKLKIFENKINDSEHLAFIKGNMKNNITPKVRVISSSILLENILVGGKLPDTFNKTMKYFKKFRNCILVFINENNLSLTNVSFKNKKKTNILGIKKRDSMIKNYGIGAQILKELKIRKMTLLTKTPKNVIGLDGFNIKIINQEIIK